MSKGKERKNKEMMHTVIGIGIMILFQFIPTFSQMTDLGMSILGIFIGTLYLWSTVDPLWSSLLPVLMVGFTSYDTMSNVVSSYLGNATTFQLLFTMIFTSALLYYGITKHIVRFCLSLKAVNGKPWAITFLLMGTNFLTAVFIGPFASIFIFFPIMYDVYEQVGFKKEDLYVKITLIQVVILSLIGSAITPYRGSVLSTLNFFTSLIAEDTTGQVKVNDGQYFLYTFALGCIMLVVFTLFSKFVLKTNVEPLRNFSLEDIQKTELAPMNTQQKVLLGSFGVYIFWQLFPAFFENIPIMAFLSSNTNAASATVVVVLMLIQIDGKPVIEFQKIMTQKFSWATYFLSATAIFFGTVLTSDVVGLKGTLNVLLEPVFANISVFMFFVLLVIFIAILTNIGNNIVMGMLLIPIAYTYASSNGLSAVPMVMILTFTANAVAALTPAASAYSAIMFGNTEWLNMKDIYKYSTCFVVIELIIILLVGIPLVEFFY